MRFYRWAMRNGAAILFVVALAAFLVSLFGQFLLGTTSVGHVSFPDEPGQASVRLIFLVNAIGGALSNSATIFAAACIVYWLERRSNRKDGAE